MGLFFLAVGMSFDLSVVVDKFGLVSVGVVAMMVVKSLCVYGVARAVGTSRPDATDRAVLMAQGGEF